MKSTRALLFYLYIGLTVVNPTSAFGASCFQVLMNSAEDTFYTTVDYVTACLNPVVCTALNVVQPWRAASEIKTGPIWSPEQQRVVHDLIEMSNTSTGWTYSWEGTGDIFNKDPIVLADLNFTNLSKNFGEVLSEPLVQFIKERLLETEAEGIYSNRVTLSLRTENASNSDSFRSGHSHGFSRAMTWSRTEMGPPSLKRRFFTNSSSRSQRMVPVKDDHTLRINYQWHAKPEDDKKPRLIILLSVYWR